MRTAIDDVVTAFAHEVGPSGPVTVRGGSTRWDSGGAVLAGTREVSAPRGIVSVQPEEMVVTVRAGTSVRDLHEALAEHGQRTPLPQRRAGTVGGALAVGENDVARLGRGAMRDAVLQVRYVSAEGDVVTAGAPTVKNVSGFDLPRLLVGSLGTLGLLAEVVIRTQPIAEVEQWFEAPDADAVAVLDEMWLAASILTDGTHTWVLLAGLEADVVDERSRLGRLGSFSPASQPTLPANRWSVEPASVCDFGAEAAGNWIGEVGVGVVHADRPQPRRALVESTVRLMDRIKAEFDPGGRLNPGRRP